MSDRLNWFLVDKPLLSKILGMKIICGIHEKEVYMLLT